MCESWRWRRRQALTQPVRPRAERKRGLLGSSLMPEERAPELPNLSGKAFVELSTEHARKQLETLTEQTTQLLALAQKATLATAEPLKTGAAKAFNRAA